MSSIVNRRSPLGCIATLVVVAALLAGCGNNKEMGEAQTAPPPSLMQSLTTEPNGQPNVQPTPTIFRLGPLVEPDLDLMAGPVPVPLELQIPALKVDAPVLGVGITTGNVMDSPKGPIDDPVWQSVFWYRGGGIPGDIGVATIAGHINDPLGRPEIFADLQKLKPGDLIVVHLKNTTMDIHFKVDEVMVLSTKESTDPAMLARIYGAGAVHGTGPQPSPDGLSHLTLITCAGYIINGQFDHHTVVFATRID